MDFRTDYRINSQYHSCQKFNLVHLGMNTTGPLRQNEQLTTDIKLSSATVRKFSNKVINSKYLKSPRGLRLDVYTCPHVACPHVRVST